MRGSRRGSKDHARNSPRRHGPGAKGAATAHHSHLPVTLEEPVVASAQPTPTDQSLQPTAKQPDLPDETGVAAPPVGSAEAVKDSSDEPCPDPREPLPGRAAIDRRVSMGEVIRTTPPVRRVSIDNSTPITKAGSL